MFASKPVNESGGSVSRPLASASGPAVTSAVEPGCDSAARSSDQIIRCEVCDLELAARLYALAWREISYSHSALQEFCLLIYSTKLIKTPHGLEFMQK